MSFIAPLISGDKGAGYQAQGTNVLQPSTVAQANQQYANANAGLSQQQAFVNALAGQGGIQNQSQVYSQLQGLANGTGPSVAQNQLNQATGQNVANQAALMAGQRGAGSNAGLLARQAAMQGANTQQQAAGQAATLRSGEQMNALGQMGSLATQQVGQQAQGLSTYNQAAQGLQQNVLNGVAQQNNASVGMQSNVNQANATIANTNAQGQQRMLGGMLSGAGSALNLAHGGMVPEHFADGGQVSSGGSFMGGWNRAMGFNNNNQGGPNQVQPGASQGPQTAQDVMGQGGFDFGKGLAQGAMKLFGPSADAGAAGLGMGGGAAGSAALFALAGGGDVPGKAKVKGDSPKNDTVPTMLSPGEIVIPRSITQHPNAPQLAAQFVQKTIMSGKGGQHLFEGGLAAPASISADTSSGDDMLGSMLAQSTQPSREDTFNQGVEQELKNPSLSFNPFGSQSGLPTREDAEKRVLERMASERTAGDNQQFNDKAKQEEMNALRVKAGLDPIAAAQPGAPPGPQGGQQPPQMQSAQGNPDVYGTDAMMHAYGQGIGEIKAGIGQQMRADQMQSRGELAAANNQESQMSELQRNYAGEFAKLQEQYGAFQQKIAEDRINPDRYLQNMGGAQKTRTAIGLILGGIGGGILGQENPALKFLNAQIDRDINSQKANLDSDHNLLSANMKQFGNIHDATMATRAMQTEIYSAQLKKAAAEAGSPAAQARALQAAGQLDMQTAPILQQLAMRKTLMGGMNSGQVDPSVAIRFLVPKEQQEHAYKELQSAQEIAKVRDNAIAAFDKVAEINSVGGRVGSPLQTPRQVAALKEPIVAAMSKATAGKFTDQDAKMLDTLWKAPGDSPATVRMKRQKFIAQLSEKDNHPILSSFGIQTSNLGRFSPQGQSRIQEAAPVLKKAN